MPNPRSWDNKYLLFQAYMFGIIYSPEVDNKYTHILMVDKERPPCLHLCQKKWRRFWLPPKLAWQVLSNSSQNWRSDKDNEIVLDQGGRRNRRSVSNYLRICCQPPANTPRKIPRCDIFSWTISRSSQDGVISCVFEIQG